MNQVTDKKAETDESVSSSSLASKVSRISIGSDASNGTNRAHRFGKTLGQNLDTALGYKVGNGDSSYTRFPHNQPSHQLSSLHQSFNTLGTPSLTTSYSSEGVSENVNSSFFDDEANLNGSLCLKVEQLQQQVEALTQSQASQDERYKRTRKENDDLLNRIHLLEDQLRDLEIQSEKQSREDEKRFKETMAKQIKSVTQECEQHLQNNYQLQQEIISLQRELIRSENVIKQLRSEKIALESELNDKNSELVNLDEEMHKLKMLVKHMKDEENVKSNIINILNEELEDNQNRSQQLNHNTSSSTLANSQFNGSSNRQASSRRSSVTSGFGEDNSSGINSKTLKDIDALEAGLAKLREDNRRLKEHNEELQAQLLNNQLEEGRSLIQEGNKSYSLADEMGDIDVNKLMEALKDQQDDNNRLRKYIDDILLKIVENNPEILDKTANTTSNTTAPTSIDANKDMNVTC